MLAWVDEERGQASMVEGRWQEGDGARWLAEIEEEVAMG